MKHYLPITTEYPCHPDRKVKLSAIKNVPVQRFTRQYPDCWTRWEIERRTASEDDEKRIDIVEWEVK